MKGTLPLLAVCVFTACAGAKIEKQKKEIEDLQVQAGSMLAELKGKSDEIGSLVAAKAELEGKNVELEGRAAAAEGRAAMLSKSNKDLSDAIGASKDELSAKINAIVAEKDELSKKLSDVLKEKLSLERRLLGQQAARDKAARELAKIREEAAALSARLADIDAQNKKAEGVLAAARLRARDDMGNTADAVLQELQSGSARMEPSDDGFTISLSDALFFDEGSAKVLEKGAALLARVGAALKTLPIKSVRIEGHSDNTPFKKGLLGGYAGHWELSSARATAVVRWLHEHAGLDPARLSAAGFGEFRPASPNDTPEGRAGNRRIAIVVSLATP